MNVLLTGKNGQLGRTLNQFLTASGHKVVAWDKEELDLNETELICEKLSSVSYDILINTAAYTAVDKAEDDREVVFRCNCDAPAIMAAEAAQRGAGFIHFSTDFVFDGLYSRPYLEDDRTNPINVYGASKADGEVKVLAAHENAHIFRTSWVYAEHGKNFYLTMRRLGGEKEALGVVKDQIGTPTSVHTLAKVVKHFAEHNNLPGGIYHVSDEGVASWYDFAHAIMELSGLNCKVNPIPATSYPTPAKRPSFSVLNKSKVAEQTGLELPHWREALIDVINRTK